jgi:multimeric flavodoxin WrbA
MTQVLAVAASARRGGNSDTILQAAIEVFRQRGAAVETIIPRKLSITPCLSCHRCWDTGVCVVQDPMQELYGRFVEVDHVVVASPLYFTSLPGHFKVLIDRFQCFWVRAYRLKNPPGPRRAGMFLAVGAMHRQRYYASTETIVKTWMSVLNMKCAVSRFYMGLDARDDVQRHPDYLEDARQAAAELLDVRLE